MTLGDIVVDNARRFPDTAAYRLDVHAVTHRELHDRAVHAASAMAGAGLRHQDRIAVLGRNSVEFGVLLAAAQLSGIVVATVSFRSTARDALDALSRVSPSIVFCEAEFAAMMTEIVGRLAFPPRLVCIDDPPPPGFASLEDFVAGASGNDLPFTAQPQDIAYLLFTSGTTGASKCCVLGHRELHRVAFTLNSEMRTGCDDRGLINMPMFHFGALSIIAGLHARGATAVLQRQFDPVAAVDMIASEAITVLHLAPVMLQALLDELTPDRDLPSVRTVVYAAAPMTPGTLQRAMHTLPSAGFVNLYGQTEASVSALPRELHSIDSEEAERRLVSVGYPMRDVRIRIVDDHGCDVATGTPGEIVVRSDTMFRGYWQDDPATMATLQDGWCHTGDIGKFDDRGLLYLVDRKKDVIITGGENVYSPEVEAAVGEMPGISACAVVGVDDARWGEAVCAVVVPRPGSLVTLANLQAFLRDRIARFKLPRYLVSMDELPVLASGKVDKKTLRTIARDQLR